VWLSRFLSGILQYAVGLIPNSDDFFDENLLDSQGRILTALYEL